MLAGLEAEGRGVLLVELAPALVQAAIDQEATTVALDHMAGAGDTAVRTVKRDLQSSILV